MSDEIPETRYFARPPEMLRDPKATFNDLAKNEEVTAWASRFLARIPSERETRYSAAALNVARRRLLRNLKKETPNPAPATRHITEFVVKTVTDCNFRCTYPCYEYLDESWQNLPPVMPDEVVENLGRCMGEYAAQNSLAEVSAIFHGGEPLFMKKPEDYYDRIIPILLGGVACAAPDTRVNLGMQTNGTLLRRPILDVLKAHGVKVGVSVDGDKAAHDARRLARNGRKGTFDLVMKGLELLRSDEYKDCYSHILCVLNVDADPVASYKALRDLQPPALDFLLPYGTHDQPPARVGDGQNAYADWLLEVYWRWVNDHEAPPIRLFQSIEQLGLGGASETEAIGPDTGGDVVIRTDGSVELIDALKVAAEDAAFTGMNVCHEDFAFDAVADFLRTHHHLGKKTIADNCRDCPILELCGGGHISTRHSQAKGFNNPSVYCQDYRWLIPAISGNATKQLDLAIAHQLDLQPNPPRQGGCC